MTKEQARAHLERWCGPARLMTVTAALIVLVPVFGGIFLEAVGLIGPFAPVEATPPWVGAVALICLAVTMIGWGMGMYHLSLAQRHGFVKSFSRSGRFELDLTR